MSIYKKLMNIQEELKAPKGQYNSFGKYKYRSCEDILEAVKPILVKNKCTLIIADSLENIGERYYVKATVKVIDIETGEAVENTAFAREEESRKGMNGDQLTGACSSYARKYALNGMFCIDDTKDSDTGKPDNSKEKPDEELKNKIEEIKKNAGEDDDILYDILMDFRLQGLKEATSRQLDDISEELSRRKGIRCIENKLGNDEKLIKETLKKYNIDSWEKANLTQVRKIYKELKK